MRNTLMTMFMLKNVNGAETKGNSIYSMIYMMIVTGLIDMIMKYFPVIIIWVQNKYTNKMTEKINNMTTDILDNKLKTKAGSIIMDIVVNDATNVTSQAILDYITNHKNTIFISYKKQTYSLNQKDVIALEDDYYACMLENTESVSGNTQSEVQSIEIYSFIHNTTEIRRFVDRLTYNYSLTMKNKLGNQKYYFNMNPYDTPVTMEAKSGVPEQGWNKKKQLGKLPPNFEFIMKPFQTNRSFSNLFGEKMDKIRDRVKFFIHNKRWYDEKGIPYTLGILLSGPPGTGKTSTIKCIANETNRHIFNINLNNDITKKQLENLFFNENVIVTSPGQNGRSVTGQICIPLEQRIYVLEDIDCQSNLVLDRSLQEEKQEDNTEAVDLSFLLNLLDGILENPGRIVIMTSNYPERLDRALIRPGRIDVIAKFDYCSHKTMMDMIEFFYDKKMTEDEKKNICGLSEYSITPAELSKIMFENFGDYQNMYKQLKDGISLKIDNGTTFLVQTDKVEAYKVEDCSDVDEMNPGEEIHDEEQKKYDEIHEEEQKKSEEMFKQNKREMEERLKTVHERLLFSDTTLTDVTNHVTKHVVTMNINDEFFDERIQKALYDRNYDEESKKYKEISKTSSIAPGFGSIFDANDFGKYLNQDIDGIGTL